MDFVVSGQVTQVLPMQQGTSQSTGNQWASQSFILCYEQGQYPKSICFKVFGLDKINNLAIKQGEQLTVHFNLEAKQGQKGYFNDVTCWKVDRGVQQAYAPQQPQYQQQAPFPPQQQYQQPVQQQPVAQAPFPPQQPVQQPAQPQGQQLPFPPQQ